MYKQDIDVIFNKEIMLLRFYIFLKYNINDIDFMQSILTQEIDKEMKLGKECCHQTILKRGFLFCVYFWNISLILMQINFIKINFKILPIVKKKFGKKCEF